MSPVKRCCFECKCVMKIKLLIFMAHLERESTTNLKATWKF